MLSLALLAVCAVFLRNGPSSIFFPTILFMGGRPIPLDAADVRRTVLGPQKNNCWNRAAFLMRGSQFCRLYDNRSTEAEEIFLRLQPHPFVMFSRARTGAKHFLRRADLLLQP